MLQWETEQSCDVYAKVLACYEYYINCVKRKWCDLRYAWTGEVRMCYNKKRESNLKHLVSAKRSALLSLGGQARDTEVSKTSQFK